METKRKVAQQVNWEKRHFGFLKHSTFHYSASTKASSTGPTRRCLHSVNTSWMANNSPRYHNSSLLQSTVRRNRHKDETVHRMHHAETISLQWHKQKHLPPIKKEQLVSGWTKTWAVVNACLKSSNAP